MWPLAGFYIPIWPAAVPKKGVGIRIEPSCMQEFRVIGGPC